MYTNIREFTTEGFKIPKRKAKQILKSWKIDITSLAIRKQHKKRYMRLKRKTKTAKAKYLKIDYIVLWNNRTKRGYYRATTELTVNNVNKFVKDIGIDKTQIAHDKGFIFKFGVQYWSMREKQKIEHIFGFKRVAFEKFKRGEIKTAQELINLYEFYFNKMGLEKA